MCTSIYELSFAKDLQNNASGEHSRNSCPYQQVLCMIEFVNEYQYVVQYLCVYQRVSH
jgi:hypothetical protein